MLSKDKQTELEPRILVQQKYNLYNTSNYTKHCPMQSVSRKQCDLVGLLGDLIGCLYFVFFALSVRNTCR